MISKDNLKDLYPLSPMQEGMLFQTLMAPERDIYHEQVVYYLNGVIDPGRMEQAWKSLFVRHDILRTVFISEKVKRPLQAVLHQHCGPFCYFDECTGNSRQRNTGQAISFDDQTIQKIVKQHQHEDLADRFDLLRTPLMRMRLLKLADQQYALIWSMHHIIMDGWCTPLLLNDFLSVYYGQSQSKPTGLPYNQYIQWLEQQEPSQAKSFWQGRLASVTQPAKIPFQPFQKGTNRPLATDAAPIDAMQTTQSETVAITGTQKLKTRCVMSREHYTHVKTISRQWQVTENAVIQAGWALLLAHYNNQSEKDFGPEQTQRIVFGTLVSGRPQHLSGIENTLGVFINTIPMVVSIDDQSTFVDLCRQVQSWLLESADSQYLPLSEIQSCSPLGNHLINHVFAFENFPRLDNHAEVAHGDGFEVKKTEKVEDVPYDFALVVSPDILTDQQALNENSTLAFEFLFNQKQFPEDLGHRIFSHLTTLLDSMGNIVQLDQIPAMEINYVPEAEIALITEFNDTKRPVPEVTSFIALFEKAALEQPDAIALIDEHVTWTYQDLNNQASSLTRILIDEMGVEKGDHIGLSVNQGHQYILAVLTIAKCNAVFIPSDPGYPGKRQVQTFEQASCRYVFVGQLSEQMTEQLSESQGDTLRYVDFSVLQTRAMGNQQHLEHSDTRTSTESSVKDLAYIIYTSGSTGTPKGVMIEQQGLINLIRWSQNAFELKPGSKITLFASTAFDASIWETLPGLCCGATLVKFPRTIRTDSGAIAAFIEKQQIDVAFVPPALCSELVTLYSHQIKNCRLLSGGDVLGNLGAMLSDVRVINNYGPSEFSVVATSGVLKSEDHYPYSIGRPIDNTELLILDRHHRTLPIGVPGEIALSGLSLGRGYFGNDTQTGQRFIAHPYDPDKKIYLTGDRGRWIGDGYLSFEGRLDHQIALRGHRIEPVEVEKQLLRHPDIKSACVVAVTNSGQNKSVHLTGFVVRDSEQLTETALKDWASRALPDYMVPAEIKFLETLPLNSNGKVDRNYLMTLAINETDTSSIAHPLTETEAKIAAIWKQVLGLEQVDRNAHFLQIGGHSLTATRTVSLMKPIFGDRITMPMLFQNPVLKQLAQAIDKSQVAATRSEIVNHAHEDQSATSLRRRDRSQYRAQVSENKN